ncbi:hypothetical protein DFH06DRAFT_1340679 [Mycena polygramma]|nr:hypothetical protein DFH06DRAFT_1340679 [Mycena polygramma]
MYKALYGSHDLIAFGMIGPDVLNPEKMMLVMLQQLLREHYPTFEWSRKCKIEDICNLKPENPKPTNYLESDAVMSIIGLVVASYNWDLILKQDMKDKDVVNWSKSVSPIGLLVMVAALVEYSFKMHTSSVCAPKALDFSIGHYSSTVIDYVESIKKCLPSRWRSIIIACGASISGATVASEMIPEDLLNSVQEYMYIPSSPQTFLLAILTFITLKYANISMTIPDWELDTETETYESEDDQQALDAHWYVAASDSEELSEDCGEVYLIVPHHDEPPPEEEFQKSLTASNCRVVTDPATMPGLNPTGW